MNRSKWCLVPVSWLVCGSAHAVLIGVNLDFSIGSAASPVFDMGSFSGSASFTYDDSTIAPTGYTTFSAITLDSLNLSPNYGGFDTGNVFAWIRFFDGAFDLALIGARLGGGDDELSVISGTNDFIIEFFQSLSLNDFAVAKAAFLGIIDEESGLPYSGALAMESVAVPEPAGLWLFIPGFLALAFGQRCKTALPIGARRRPIWSESALSQFSSFMAH